MRNAPIGIMDSGVGGLTVVKEIWRQLPREEVLFYGDSLRCPYGDKSPAEISAFTFRALDALVARGVKMLVIACNTATAICLQEARERYSVPVFGVIAPGSRAAIAATRSLRVGVIGTRATIASGSYAAALHMTHRGIEVCSTACPGLVELVERGPIVFDDVYPIVEAALAPVRDAGVDTLILGCTHYPLLTEVIAAVMDRSVTLINSAEETARDVSFWLTEQHMQRVDLREPVHAFYTSGDPVRFAEIGQTWLGREIPVAWLDVWGTQGTGTDGVSGVRG